MVEDDQRFVVSIEVLVTVEDAGAVVAHPCATRISQTQEGTVEVYIPSVREAVLDRFHAVLDQWMATSAGLHVAGHTENVRPWPADAGSAGWWRREQP